MGPRFGCGNPPLIGGLFPLPRAISLLLLPLPAYLLTRLPVVDPSVPANNFFPLVSSLAHFSFTFSSVPLSFFFGCLSLSSQSPSFLTSNPFLLPVFPLSSSSLFILFSSSPSNLAHPFLSLPFSPVFFFPFQPSDPLSLPPLLIQLSLTLLLVNDASYLLLFVCR